MSADPPYGGKYPTYPPAYPPPTYSPAPATPSQGGVGMLPGSGAVASAPPSNPSGVTAPGTSPTSLQSLSVGSKRAPYGDAPVIAAPLPDSLRNNVRAMSQAMDKEAANTGKLRDIASSIDAANNMLGQIGARVERPLADLYQAMSGETADAVNAQLRRDLELIDAARGELSSGTAVRELNELAQLIDTMKPYLATLAGQADLYSGYPFFYSYTNQIVEQGAAAVQQVLNKWVAAMNQLRPISTWDWQGPK